MEVKMEVKMDPARLLRKQFPVTEELVYLNHAAVSPLPLLAKSRMAGYLETISKQGAFGYPDEFLNLLERARDGGARLLGTSPSGVFFVRSTTQGLGVAVTGLPLDDGKNMVVVEGEFPANVRPWLALRKRGVEVRMVPQREGRVHLDDLAQAVDDHTAALSISFVQFASGFRVDLGAVAELCRRHDALFIVDAIQGLGAFPLHVERLGVDFLSADAHKWMLGPEGVGLGYASPRALERIQPALEGWLSVEDPFDFFNVDQPLKADASRFEEGAYNVCGLHGLTGSLELLLELGVDSIAEKILSLTDWLDERLQASGWQVLSPRSTKEEKSGILMVTREGVDRPKLGATLKKEGFVASVRAGALRFSPHAYNTMEELEALVEFLDRSVDGAHGSGI